MLERVLEGGDPPANERQASLVSKCLAFCLSLRAVDAINAALRAFDQNLPIIEAIGRRAQSGKLDPYTTVRARGGIAQVYGARLRCMACGSIIYQTYARFTFKNIPIIVCPSCSAQLNRQQAERTRGLRLAANAAHRNLEEAAGLDPANKAVDKNRQDLRQLCSKASIALAPIPYETVKLPCEAGCLNPSSPPNRCWFCGAMLAAPPPVPQSLACRLEMHCQPRTSRKRWKNYVIYKHGYVEAPRCAACQAAHQRERKSKSVLIGCLMGVFVGMVTGAVLASSYPQSHAGLLVFLLGPAVGSIVGYLIRKMRRPKGHRSESSFAKSAEVRSLLAQGWRIGSAP